MNVVLKIYTERHAKTLNEFLQLLIEILGDLTVKSHVHNPFPKEPLVTEEMKEIAVKIFNSNAFVKDDEEYFYALTKPMPLLLNKTLFIEDNQELQATKILHMIFFALCKFTRRPNYMYVNAISFKISWFANIVWL